MAGNKGAKKGGGKMTVENRLKNALSHFGFPIENGVFQGKEDTYFVFNLETMGEAYADDAPTYDRYLVSLHLYAPMGKNLVKLKKQVKKDLFSSGFSWADCIQADDEQGRHLVFECETTEEIDIDGEV